MNAHTPPLPGQTVHSFSESLARSQAVAEEPWWSDLYRSAFPNLVAMASIKEDGWAQRGGIDRVLILSSGKTVTVEEKVRHGSWNDILLEVWSNEQMRVPGWIEKDLASDYLAYIMLPAHTAYLFPYLALRQAWLQNGDEWCSKYRIIRASNGSYDSVCVAVPIQELYDAITAALVAKWSVVKPTTLRRPSWAPAASDEVPESYAAAKKRR